MSKLLRAGTLLSVALAPLCPVATAQASRAFTTTLSAAGATASAFVDAQHHTVQVTGAPSTCTVRLEGSLDGANWFDLSGTQSCTANTMFHVDGKPLTYVRANVLTLAGGTLTITYKGSN